MTIPAMENGFTYARTEDGGSSWTTVEGGTKGRSNTGTPDSPEETPGSTADIAAIRLNELNGNDKFIELYQTNQSRSRSALRKALSSMYSRISV